MLIDAIGAERALPPLYPLETKSIELCNIGQKHSARRL
jgi:hypothetical protein